jgi:single-stranded-DNA-specific exonuclease
MTLKSSKIWNFDNTVKPQNILELLKKRGVDEIEKFLNPSLSDIPNFQSLYNSKKAATEIIEAVKQGKKLFIHGDFDSDGVCATAILWECIYNEVSEKLGVKADIKPYIPSRVDEGYGLSESSLDAMISEGAQLIITVDCGIRDRERIEKYINEKGVSIIVTDHHEPPKNIESAQYTIVHPMFPEHEYPFQKICGSTVAFLLANALRDEVGLDSKITENSKGLDLVGIATVTDLMPLLDINRTLVKYSINQIKKNTRFGLKSLLNIASVPVETLDAYHFGFVIGPRLNASGRMGHAMDALRLIVSPNIFKANEFGAKLQNLNLKRQESTFELLNQAETLLEEFKDEKLIFIHGSGWHEGVIGLVAGKIFEKTGKPTIIATTTEKEIKASARSISTFNITKALEVHSEYLVKYGGHAQAAGFTIKPECIDNFKESILKYAKENISDSELQSSLDIDIDACISDITLELHENIEKLKPFGYGNTKPLICIQNSEVTDKRTMSEGKHMKLKLTNDGNEISVLMFNCTEDIPNIETGNTIDVVGNISINEWNGNTSTEMIIKEWK